MTLFGECADCGESAALRFKPDVPASEQSAPSICQRCHDLRDEMYVEVTRINNRGVDPVYDGLEDDR